MAVASSHPPRSSSLRDKRPQHRSDSSSNSISYFLEEDSRDMTQHLDLRTKERTKSAPEATIKSEPSLSHAISSDAGSGDSTFSNGGVTPSTPGRLSRTGSFSDLEDELGTTMERLSVFDLLENLALRERLERFQSSIAARTEKVLRRQERLKSSGLSAKDKVVEEWRRRVPTADEQLDRYRKRMRTSVDRLTTKWNDSRSVTLREKASFIAGVLNIFITGYLVGAHPEWFHYWYTIQLFYFMPIRLYTYQKKGYHYFLADLCYFVNFLTILSIFVFPRSKRLFISTYCLAFGNNAIAIAMWRNSLVFHSMDKIVSLFIHIMPCVTLHCLVHLLPSSFQEVRYPAIHTILNSEKSSPEHYTLPQMMFWASIPYAVWQLSYHFLITVRRRDKIAAGRPTSFTWLRKSFATSWLGKIVLSLPLSLQEPAYMLIQYFYALLTMVPCPLWFWSRWASGVFLTALFSWSVWNGATYYIDVFGKRFQKELEALKKDVAKWQSTTDLQKGLGSPILSPGEGEPLLGLDASAAARAAEPVPELVSLKEDDEMPAKEAVPGIAGEIGSEQLETPTETKKEV